jgi:predicted metal-dependent HD superfamily phosphohydrolase
MNPFKTFNNLLKPCIHEKGLKELPLRWSEPHRYYHNTTHLVNIIHDIETNMWFKGLTASEKRALMIAAFYHDAIYNPKKDDNEERSVKLFLRDFGGTDIRMIDAVCGLIMVTKYRKRPGTKLKKIFWDADNAGFKKGFDWLMKTEKLIQKEYSYLPKEKFREGKIKFLETNIGLFGDKADKDIQKLIEYYRDRF